MIRRASLAATVAALALAPMARAAEPGDLTALAQILGESQALREVCEGAQAQYWRSRMMRLLDLERPDEALSARLSKAFNAGYAARKRDFPACSPESQALEAEIAGRGEQLAARLAAQSPLVEPDSVAEPPAAR